MYSPEDLQMTEQHRDQIPGKNQSRSSHSNRTHTPHKPISINDNRRVANLSQDAKTEVDIIHAHSFVSCLYR